MTRKDFIRQAEKAQKRAYRFPDIPGYDKQERNIKDCKCIIYSKQNSKHNKAIVYYPGGGYIRYQIPDRKSIRNYIDKTGCDLWIPLYPLYPKNDMYDGVKFGYELHRIMLET